MPPPPMEAAAAAEALGPPDSRPSRHAASRQPPPAGDGPALATLASHAAKEQCPHRHWEQQPAAATPAKAWPPAGKQPSPPPNMPCLSGENR